MQEIYNAISQVHERVANIKEDDDENEPMQLRESASPTTSPIIRTESKVNESETLAVADVQSAFITPSHDLREEVPVEYTGQQHDAADLKGQATESQQALVSVISPADEANNYLRFPGCRTSSDGISPSVAQSILFGPSQILQEQRVSPLAKCSSRCVAEVTGKISFDSNSGSDTPIVKASSAGGYNWRKYGQKQVKSPQGSRSYYKCTYSDCYAKKIESSSSSSSGIEVTYKSHHNHDPPQQVNCAREKRLALSVVPIVGSSSTNPVQILRFNEVATSSEESIDKKLPVTGTEQQNSSGSSGNAKMNDMDQHLDKPEPKQRVKKSSLVSDDPVCTPGKKPKFVVHVAGDVGISGDGYRWRKYGQKAVKGTPHPRNYYRCTSAGCPVRKHTEMATKSMDALIITYKGIHDHDMPVPKKRHGPPSAPLLIASAPASLNDLNFQTPEALRSEKSPTKRPIDTEGELTGQTMEPGGQKTTNSARTLLSIGFEIKPC